MWLYLVNLEFLSSVPEANLVWLCISQEHILHYDHKKKLTTLRAMDFSISNYKEQKGNLQYSYNLILQECRQTSEPFPVSWDWCHNRKLCWNQLHGAVHYHKYLKDHNPTILRDNETYKVLEGLITVSSKNSGTGEGVLPIVNYMGGFQQQGVTFQPGSIWRVGIYN